MQFLLYPTQNKRGRARAREAAAAFPAARIEAKLSYGTHAHALTLNVHSLATLSHASKRLGDAKLTGSTS